MQSAKMRRVYVYMSAYTCSSVSDTVSQQTKKKTSIKREYWSLTVANYEHKNISIHWILHWSYRQALWFVLSIENDI